MYSKGVVERTLVCFDPKVKDLVVKVSAEIHERSLALEYTVAGNLADVVMPALSKHPARRDGLWEHTCFEAFWAVNRRKAYWEMNLSPSLDWNVYSFSDYRKGQQQEGRILHLETRREEAHFTAKVDLGGLLKPSEEIDLGLTAVLETKTRGLTYWALIHKGSEPDFHLRKSFIC